MGDLQRIQGVLARARRRMRAQIALEVLATAAVPAVAAELMVVWLWRMSHVRGTSALAAVVVIAGVWSLSAFAWALRKIPALAVAARVDRASGLASRLSTACELADELGRPGKHHPDT